MFATIAVSLSMGQTKIVVVLMLALAVATIVVAIMSLFGEQEERMVDRLERYSSPAKTVADPSDTFVETPIVQQAVDLTGRLADRMRLLDWLENTLEQGDLPIRAPEALFFFVAGVLLAFLLFLVIAPTFFAAFFFTLLASSVPLVLLFRARAKRKKAFDEQLPSTLQLLAGAMRSGFSLLQALEASAAETGDPMRRELTRVLTETRLGRSLEDALDDCAARIDSLDLSWAVMAIRIQREVGGNLAELLDNVSDTMTQRDRLRSELRSLTAEGRYSGMILGLMPLFFAGVLYSLNPEFMKPLFEDVAGLMVLGSTFVLSGLGFLWIRKIMNIEV
jgi:tight adherence protein B